MTSIIELNDNVKEILAKRIQRGSDAGMHTVTVIWQDPITALHNDSTGYFTERLEAEAYAEFLHKTYQEKWGFPHFVFVDGELWSGGKLKNQDSIEEK